MSSEPVRGYRKESAAHMWTGEGREEGEYIKLITLLQRKVKRGKTLAEMAAELEESEDTLRPIYEALRKKGADCPAEEVYAYLNAKA